MELDLQSLFGIGIHVHSCWYRYSLAETTHTPPSAFRLIYEGAIGQPRKTTSLCNPLVYLAEFRIRIPSGQWIRKRIWNPDPDPEGQI
jgi:hypothetical protein